MSPFPLTVIVPLRRVGCWLLTGALYGVLWQLLPSVADDVAVLSGRTLLGLVPFCRLELVKLRKEPVVVPLTSTCLEAGRDVSTALLDKGSMLVLQKYSFSRNAFGKHIVSVHGCWSWFCFAYSCRCSWYEAFP